MVVVSEGVLNELRQGAQAGTAAAQLLEDQQVEAELVGAFKAGKLTLAPIPDGKGGTTTEIDHWRALLKGPGKEQARALLAAAAPRFGTSELGSPTALPDAIDDAQFAALEESMFGWTVPAAGAAGAAQ